MTVILCVAEEETEDYGEKFTLDDYLDKTFRPKSFQSSWLSGKRHHVIVDRVLIRSGASCLPDLGTGMSLDMC